MLSVISTSLSNSGLSRTVEELFQFLFSLPKAKQPLVELNKLGVLLCTLPNAKMRLSQIAVEYSWSYGDCPVLS